MIMKKHTLLTVVLATVLLFAACKSDDDNSNSTTPTGNQSNLNLNITGLEDLGANYAYEGWMIVEGKAITTGVFNVDGNGNLSQTAFPVNATDLAKATAFVLTIEPSPDNDPAPSSVHILAGDFSGGNSSLTVSHRSALGTDFTASAGSYILATPTDGMNNNESSGVWWLDPSGPSATLTLPTLPSGWKYEGWAVINGTPVSTGTFTSVTGADDAAPFSGSMMAPPFPGEDFLQNAPAGLTFPVDLSGSPIVISVEPFPDNSPAPFTLKPLLGNTPAMANTHTLLPMMNNAAATNPTGTATR
jgi:hypothetical protein